MIYWNALGSTVWYFTVRLSTKYEYWNVGHSVLPIEHECVIDLFVKRKTDVMFELNFIYVFISGLEHTILLIEIIISFFFKFAARMTRTKCTKIIRYVCLFQPISTFPLVCLMRNTEGQHLFMKNTMVCDFCQMSRKFML